VSEISDIFEVKFVSNRREKRRHGIITLENIVEVIKRAALPYIYIRINVRKTADYNLWFRFCGFLTNTRATDAGFSGVVSVLSGFYVK